MIATAIDIQNPILNANNPINSKISNIKKSVANIHPTKQISNAITIIVYTNDINDLIVNIFCKCMASFCQTTAQENSRHQCFKPFGFGRFVFLKSVHLHTLI